jgi:Uma2 family endonuclease
MTEQTRPAIFRVITNDERTEAPPTPGPQAENRPAALPRSRRLRKRLTVQEYQRTHETVLPQELIFGAVRVADAPLVSHQRLVFSLARALHAHVRAQAPGEVLTAPIDVVLDDKHGLVLQPDVIYVSSARGDIIRDRILGAPDLVLEVLSPHPRLGSLEERVRWYAQYGVREVWMYHEFARRLDIAACGHGLVMHTSSFDRLVPIRSLVLPSLTQSTSALIDIW